MLQKLLCCIFGHNYTPRPFVATPRNPSLPMVRPIFMRECVYCHHFVVLNEERIYKLDDVILVNKLEGLIVIHWGSYNITSNLIKGDR